MKTFIKLLFVIAAIYFVAPVVVAGDAISGAVVLFVLCAVITGLAVPYKYINNGQLGVLDITVWKKYIIEKLRKNNAFMFKSKDDTRYVLGGLTVVIPQSGADPTIIINNTTWPLTAVRRTDTDVNYLLDSYSTTPHHIPWIELQSISYQKIDSILGAHTNSLAEAVSDNMLIKWAPTVIGKQVATTGGPTAITQGPVAGQTLTRKVFHPKDLITVMSAFNAANIPDKGRNIVIDSNMYGPFYDQLSDSQANAYNQFADNETGRVGRLHGFDIFVRSSALVYASASATAKAYGAAIAASDNLAALAWHEDMVCRAFGEMKPFQDKDNPLYQGDIFSMIVRAGGRKERQDDNGVIAVVQGA